MFHITLTILCAVFFFAYIIYSVASAPPEQGEAAQPTKPVLEKPEKEAA